MNNKEIQAHFSAPTGLKSGHAQTLYAATRLNPSILQPQQRLTIRVSNRAQLLCDWNWAEEKQGQTCLILVHGLESSSQSHYMRSTARKALERKLDVIRINLRACGNSIHLSETLYHAGLSEDLLKVCLYAVQHLNYQQVVVAGFSLGAQLVLKMAGESGAQYHWLKGACAISPPLNLAESSKAIMRPDNYIYERYYYRSMRQTYQKRRRWWPEKTNLAILKKAKNLQAFDEFVTAPEFSYANAQDYYQQNSAENFLAEIKVPTRIIHAVDDPIIPFDSHRRAIEKHTHIE